MQIRHTKLSDAVPLILLIIVTYLHFIGFAPQNSLKFVYMALIIQVPGFYFTKIVGRQYSLKIDEYIVSNVIFSCLTILFSYILLSTIVSQVTSLILWATLTFISFGSAMIFYINAKSKDEYLDTDINSIVALLLCYIPSIVIITMALPQEFWRGSDAWETHSIVSTLISNSMSPDKLISYWESFVYLYNFGYYYLLAAFSLATGFSVDSILRYGGIFQSAFLALITYISVKKMTGMIGGFLASWIIFLNPSMVLRWVTPIRENFSILLLLFTVYYVQLVNSSKGHSRLLNISVYTALLLASVFIHTLTPIFILGVYFSEGLNKYLNGLCSDALEYVASTGTAILILSLFYPYTADPFASFLRNNPMSLALIALGSLTLVLGFVLLKRFNIINIMQMWKTRAVLVSFFVLTVILAIIYPPSYELGYNYGYIEQDNFFMPFLALSLIGAFSFVKARVPLAIGFIALMIATSLVTSYFGIEVPLSRLTIYVTWVMSYVIVHFLSTIYVPVKMGTPRNVRGLLSVGVEWGKANKVLLVIALVFAAMAVNEVEHQRRFIPTFSSYEVESVKGFVQCLGDGDLVYAQNEAEIILYYLGIPRDNIVHNASKERELSAILEESSPYFVSELVQENYPEIKRFHIALHGHEYLALSIEPINTLFQFYTRNQQYGSTFVYSLNIPFTLETIEPQNVKFIETLNDSVIIEDGGQKSWEQSISSISNCVFEPDEAYPFKMYYTGINIQGNNYLGLAYSADGLIWSKCEEPIYACSLSQLYLIRDGRKLYLFGQRASDLSIIRIESANGINWGNESLLFDQKPGETIRVQESPIVWKENGTWHMLFWELSTSSDTYHNGMIYANSSDGLHWKSYRDLVNWALYDSTYRNIEYYKIFPMNIIKTKDGYTVLARCLSKDSSHTASWIPCTIYIVDNLFNPSTVYNYLFFISLRDPIKIDTIHQFFNPVISRTQFFYIDYDDYYGQGTTNGVIAGFISDHLHVS